MTAAALIKTHLSFINLGHQHQLPCSTPHAQPRALALGSHPVLPSFSQCKIFQINISKIYKCVTIHDISLIFRIMTNNINVLYQVILP